MGSYPKFVREVRVLMAKICHFEEKYDKK